ncbi:hypothetical protein BN1232_04388 [Mycobacterium lentiflavum]|uniref:Uncharacterized protein n=1 Tax=Mycobacterium lentiflavum TaxID=141349 RepID=A0A0E4CPR6_MYCLN|nr:hypothetical protein [Mycobacterium lentiflavum]CQD18929.1 hypothetical protein BN1232_04388 [Mycobacterium lentiflavum]
MDLIQGYRAISNDDALGCGLSTLPMMTGIRADCDEFRAAQFVHRRKYPKESA